MVARGEGRLVVWPHYFDRNLSRAQGRRVPTDLAIEAPKAGHIAHAAKTLGYKVEIEEDARPPNAWYTNRGRVLLTKPGETKEAVLKAIARRL